MANLLQLSEYANPVILLKPSLTTLLASTSRRRQQCYRAQPLASPPKASLQQSSSSSPVSRRELVSQTAAISLSLLAAPRARAEDALSEWERVYLPIDPGVVLLDIAFVPDDLNHGIVVIPIHSCCSSPFFF